MTGFFELFRPYFPAPLMQFRARQLNKTSKEPEYSDKMVELLWIKMPECQIPSGEQVIGTVFDPSRSRIARHRRGLFSWCGRQSGKNRLWPGHHPITADYVPWTLGYFLVVR